MEIHFLKHKDGSIDFIALLRSDSVHYVWCLKEALKGLQPDQMPEEVITWEPQQRRKTY